jgi:hypothetical protein
MKALRLSVGIVTASAVLLGGTWAGGAFAELARGGQARSGREPPYPGSDGDVWLGDSLQVDGQPMELSLFYTQDPPERVIRFYSDAFRARDLTPIASLEGTLAHAATFDPVSGLQRFVNAVAQPDGQTLVMSGAANPRKPPSLTMAAESASFPLPPGHRAYLGFRGVDPGTRSESAQFVSALAPREVASFYRAALGTRGFTERAGAAGEGLLTFTKPGVTICIALQKLDERSGAAVFVTRTEGDL